MSYCVNCGVELAPSEKSCPLCNVAVQNPLQPRSEPSQRPYPNRVDKFVDQINRSFGVGLASLFLLIPAAVTMLTNFFTQQQISWSAYVVGACFLAYIFVLVPMLFRKPMPFLFLFFDVVALLSYLALIDYFASGFIWFFQLALPIVLQVAVVTGIMIAVWHRKAFGVLNKLGILLLAIAVLCIGMEVIINLYQNRYVVPSWSFYAAAPCIILSVVLFYTEQHKVLKEKIRRRLFY